MGNYDQGVGIDSENIQTTWKTFEQDMHIKDALTELLSSEHLS